MTEVDPTIVELDDSDLVEASTPVVEASEQFENLYINPNPLPRFVVYYPPGIDSRGRDNEQVAERMRKAYCSGSDVTLVGGKDTFGNPEWNIVHIGDKNLEEFALHSPDGASEWRGHTTSNQKIADILVEYFITEGSICLPSTRDENGELLWKVEVLKSCEPDPEVKDERIEYRNADANPRFVVFFPSGKNGLTEGVYNDDAAESVRGLHQIGAPVYLPSKLNKHGKLEWEVQKIRKDQRVLTITCPYGSSMVDGQVVPNSDIAIRLLKELEEKGSVCIPSDCDRYGNRDWEVILKDVDKSVEIEKPVLPRFAYTNDQLNQRDSLLMQTVSDMMGQILGRFEPDGSTNTLIPKGPRVTTVESGDQILLHIDLENDSDAALLIGPNKCNVQLLLLFMRVQQIRPHNKEIVLLYKSPNGKMQAFMDAHLFSRRGKVPATDFYIAHGVPAPHIKVNKPSRATKASEEIVAKFQNEGLVNNNAQSYPKTREGLVSLLVDEKGIPEFLVSKLSDVELEDLLNSLLSSPKKPAHPYGDSSDPQTPPGTQLLSEVKNTFKDAYEQGKKSKLRKEKK